MDWHFPTPLPMEARSLSSTPTDSHGNMFFCLSFRHYRNDIFEETCCSLRLLILWSALSLSLPSFAHEDSVLQGDLQALFSKGVRHEVSAWQGFPSAEEFYTKYSNPSRPVLFKGGAKSFPAYERWTDEYFLSFPESEQAFVVVEQEKKENRSLAAEDVSFANFVRDYRMTNTYMVNSVPDFLK